MNNFDNWLNTVFFHNKIENWLWFFGIILIGFLLKSLFSTLLSKLIYGLIKRETKGVSVLEFIRLIKKPIEFIISLTILTMAIEEIVFPKSWRVIPLGKMSFLNFVDKIFEALFILAITWLAVRITKFIALIGIEKAKETESKHDDQLVPFFRDLAISFLCFISFLVILGYVFKQDVVSLITGLGIGGVALALAARETLENLFASFTIFFDKPFVAGDSVEIGTTQQGDVEKIGFRTTRLRTPEGSLLNVPNRLMVSQNVNNLSLREFRRVKFWLKLSNDTPIEQIEELVELIKKMLALHPKTSHEEYKPYALFENFGEYALEVLVVYYIIEPEFREFKTYQSEINTEILRTLRSLGLKLAMPSQDIKVLK
jgi:MscS family membrane protein